MSGAEQLHLELMLTFELETHDSNLLKTLAPVALRC
jgi:hypothetical protein